MMFWLLPETKEIFSSDVMKIISLFVSRKETNDKTSYLMDIIYHPFPTFSDFVKCTAPFISWPVVEEGNLLWKDLDVEVNLLNGDII